MVTQGQEPPAKGKQKIFELLLKSLISFVGIAILSFGASILRLASVGLDPFTAMNTGLAAKTGMSLGVLQLGVNLVVFIFIVLLDRKKIGIGTILNMVLVGFEIQWFYDFLARLFSVSNVLTIVASTVLGLLLFTLGSSLYMRPNLGVAPYDAIAPIASTRLHVSYKTARVVQDIAFMVAAFLVGGPVGFATIIIAFFTGPLIAYWNTHLSDPLIKSVTSLAEQPSPKNIGKSLVQVTKVGYSLVKRSYIETYNLQQEVAGLTKSELQQKYAEAKRNYDNAQQVATNSKEQMEALKKEIDSRY